VGGSQNCIDGQFAAVSNRSKLAPLWEGTDAEEFAFDVTTILVARKVCAKGSESTYRLMEERLTKSGGQNEGGCLRSFRGYRTGTVGQYPRDHKSGVLGCSEGFGEPA